MNEKLIINANLLRKESEFQMKTCVVEKAIAVSHGEFENLKKHPLQDNNLIAENAELMYCDSNEHYHCLLIYDKEQGDGLLIESEGAKYARYAQYVSNAKLLYENYVQQNLHEMKLYCPLKIYSDIDISEYDWNDEITDNFEHISTYDAADFESEINAAICRYSETMEKERGLMKYYSGDPEVKQKVFSAFPSVEVKDGELIGVFNCKVSPDISDSHVEELKEYLTGQAADGWGEGFEQQEIKTSGRGKIFVSFWSSDGDWSMQTEENMETEEIEETEEQNMSM